MWKLVTNARQLPLDLTHNIPPCWSSSQRSISLSKMLCQKQRKDFFKRWITSPQEAYIELGMVAPIYNSIIQEDNAGGLLWVCNQHGLHSETLSQRKERKEGREGGKEGRKEREKWKRERKEAWVINYLGRKCSWYLCCKVYFLHLGWLIILSAKVRSYFLLFRTPLSNRI